jgi:hypothetical protein
VGLPRGLAGLLGVLFGGITDELGHFLVGESLEGGRERLRFGIIGAEGVGFGVELYQSVILDEELDRFGDISFLPSPPIHQGIKDYSDIRAVLVKGIGEVLEIFPHTLDKYFQLELVHRIDEVHLFKSVRFVFREVEFGSCHFVSSLLGT